MSCPDSLAVEFLIVAQKTLDRLQVRAHFFFSLSLLLCFLFRLQLEFGCWERRFALSRISSSNSLLSPPLLFFSLFPLQFEVVCLYFSNREKNSKQARFPYNPAGMNHLRKISGASIAICPGARRHESFFISFFSICTIHCRGSVSFVIINLFPVLFFFIY